MTDFHSVAGGDERPSEPIDPRHADFVATRDARRSNIVRLCTSILHDPGAAEEATDEAFATMWRAILDGREDAYRIPWLRAVAHDHCFDILRERKRNQSSGGAGIRGSLPTLGAYKVGFGTTPPADSANPLHGLFGRGIEGAPVAAASGGEARLFGPWREKRHESRPGSPSGAGPFTERPGARSVRRVGAASSALVLAIVIAIAAFGPAVVLPHTVLATVTHKTTTHHRSKPTTYRSAAPQVKPPLVDDVAAAISSAVTITSADPPPPADSVTTTTLAPTTTLPPVTTTSTPAPTTSVAPDSQVSGGTTTGTQAPHTTTLKRHSVSAPTPTTVPATTTTTQAVTAASATSGSSAGPGTAPDGASGNWSLNFDDEFNGTSLDTTKWSPSWFGGGTMNDVSTSPANVSVANGALSLTLSSPSVGALVDTNPSDAAHPGFTFTYGFAEARIWFPGNGSTIDNWPAFWTDGQNWPNDGEIDIAEGLGSMSGNYHSSAGTFNSPEPDTSVSTGGSWHVYGVDWEPGSITWYIDGQVVHTLTSATTPITSSPQYLIFNVGAGHTAAVGSTMLVDWVREWSKG